MAALAAAVFNILLVLLFPASAVLVESATDLADVQALRVLYGSLKRPSQLTGWSSSGGDPCGDSWKGISCSGSAVIAVQLSGLGLNGTIGYLSSNLFSLKTMDLSNNNIHGVIPYQLPRNLIYLNLANNSLSGGLPYSISTMVSLVYGNFSHNRLSQSIGDVFADFQHLSELDLSFNMLTGNLPYSLRSLSNLSTLNLQNNQLMGSVNFLAELHLSTLNIANNYFSGWIPQEFSSIPNLVIEGNSLSDGPAPPPPSYTPPPPGNNITLESSDSLHGSASVDDKHKKKLTRSSFIGIIAGCVLGALCVMLLVSLYLKIVQRSKQDTESCRNEIASSTASATDKKNGKQMQEQRVKGTTMSNLKTSAADGITFEKVYGKNGSLKHSRAAITATSYTLSYIQAATNNFAQDCLVGEGSLGRVYRARFGNGKVLAVKNIHSALLSFQEEDNFLKSVSRMSRLSHPNIVSLVGYCTEHGQRLMVYEYIRSGTLHDILHFSNSSKLLPWNARIRVAIGTARALEYLHEVCLPPMVHRNLKSGNILLDEQFNPHLSDSGVAVLTPTTERQVVVDIVGQFGYSAPEFATTGTYTAKSDVYSFGVVMLELLTGREPLDSSRMRSEQSLVSWAIPQLHDIDALSKMIDPALNGIYPVKSLSGFAEIIAQCIQPKPESRPSMPEVVQKLAQLVHRASSVRRHSADELGFPHNVTDRYASSAKVSF